MSGFAKKEQKHEFAFFSQTPLVVQDNLMIQDPEIVHRISTVLRLHVGETVILFDTQNVVTVEITQITKKAILGIIKKIKVISPVEPKITVALPLLKQDNLEDALYNCVELGASEIQLLTTAKSYPLKESLFEKRIPAIIQAAAELSKNFKIPNVKKPIKLEEFLATVKNNSFIFFDPEGQPLPSCLNNLNSKSNSAIILLVGPEGDLTVQEKELVKNASATFCALTPTILRASQAITIGLGIMRSWLKK